MDDAGHTGAPELMKTATLSLFGAPTRREQWHKFDNAVARWKAWKPAPAFVQEIVTGLWCVQSLVQPQILEYGWLYRLVFSPPPHGDYEPFYNRWPGDHRGWLSFESKESARDFYRFSTGLISFKEYQSLPHAPWSGFQIDLDETGNFAALKATEGSRG